MRESRRKTNAEPPRFRIDALEKARDQKMARSACDYIRGSPEKFYRWLAEVKKGAIPEGPPIWICGDCHSGNLGPLSNARGEFQIAIRDFDQTVIGNPAHDIVRLGLSLASAAVVSDLSGLTIAEMLEAMMRCYTAAFEPEFDEERELDEPKTVKRVNKRAKGATWDTLARHDVETQKLMLPLGRSFWPLSVEERREINSLFETGGMRELATLLSARRNDADVRVVDAAYWKKGCSSLGRLRYAVLLEVGSKSDDRQHCLMDLKEAVKAGAPHAVTVQMPGDPAERVVMGARHLSPSLGDRMRAIRLMEKSIFVRELLPQDLKIEIARLEREEAKTVAGFLAGVVGRAHAKQMTADARSHWKSELQRGRSKSLDAPTWLWRNVVELLSDHGRGYLEHCRRCALAA
jgi:uncharacterized protein (DUF2252 family)